MKTNQSLIKRFKFTRTGKVLVRHPGQNHFNAKESTRAKAAKKGFQPARITNKLFSRYLPNIKKRVSK